MPLPLLNIKSEQSAPSRISTQQEVGYLHSHKNQKINKGHKNCKVWGSS